MLDWPNFKIYICRRNKKKCPCRGSAAECLYSRENHGGQPRFEYWQCQKRPNIFLLLSLTKGLISNESIFELIKKQWQKVKITQNSRS